MARWIDLKSTSLRNGFVKNSLAPAFTAFTAIGTLPWPVMKMIGMSIRSTATRLCSSSPLTSGSERSRTRQLGVRTRGRARKSLAVANVSACQPAAQISDSRDARTEGSSSTTNTIGAAYDWGADVDSSTKALAKCIFYLPGQLSHCKILGPVRSFSNLQYVQQLRYHIFI